MTTTPAYDEVFTDVAVVGSGGAGLMAVLHVHAADPGLDITVISKGAVGRSGCTRMVQGGYNAVLSPMDSIENHFQDTLDGGKYLNDQDLAWTLVNDAPKVIHELETQVGCFFDRNEDGTIKQKAFAGQSFDRTVHRGDLTGIEIMARLRDQMFRVRPRELEDVRALELLLASDGSVAGLVCLDVRSGKFLVIRAKVVIVATGGAATMYKIAAPAREKTGDGVAMCVRAGLELRDMEMMQFHPTGLLAGKARMTGAVLEEGLRGAGAHLLNALGERYMTKYDPVRMERSTRDVVSRSSYMEIMDGRGTENGGVLIDISHLGAAEVERRFPGMVARTRQLGSDLATCPVEVSPTAHFHMGGAIIDGDCRTSVDGLLVAGEDAGGVHGANRLGGNGVAESTVFGCRAGDTAAVLARSRQQGELDSADVDRVIAAASTPLDRPDGILPFDLTTRLKNVMWEHCGVVRDAGGLDTAIAEIQMLEEQLALVSVPGPVAFNPAWNEALDLASQLTVAKVIVHCAARRTETRGAHARSDFPERNDSEWLKYLVATQAADGSIHITERPVEFSRSARPAPAPAEVD